MITNTPNTIIIVIVISSNTTSILTKNILIRIGYGNKLQIPMSYDNKVFVMFNSSRLAAGLPFLLIVSLTERSDSYLGHAT